MPVLYDAERKTGACGGRDVFSGSEMASEVATLATKRGPAPCMLVELCTATAVADAESA